MAVGVGAGRNPGRYAIYENVVDQVVGEDIECQYKMVGRAIVENLEIAVKHDGVVSSAGADGATDPGRITSRGRPSWAPSRNTRRRGLRRAVRVADSPVRIGRALSDAGCAVETRREQRGVEVRTGGLVDLVREGVGTNPVGVGGVADRAIGLDRSQRSVRRPGDHCVGGRIGVTAIVAGNVDGHRSIHVSGDEVVFGGQHPA